MCLSTLRLVIDVMTAMIVETRTFHMNLKKIGIYSPLSRESSSALAGVAIFFI